MTEKSQKNKGINYVIRNTYALDKVNGIDDLKKLKGQFIPLDNMTTSQARTDIQFKRGIHRNERKHSWKNLSTRKFRETHTKFNKSKITFENISPISNLWKEYSQRIQPENINVSKMDLHGAYVTVTSSRDPSLVGVSGVVVKESYGALVIVSEDNKVRQINKNYSIIELNVQDKTFEINLAAMRCKPYQRPTKKWKTNTPLSLPF